MLSSNLWRNSAEIAGFCGGGGGVGFAWAAGLGFALGTAATLATGVGLGCGLGAGACTGVGMGLAGLLCAVATTGARDSCWTVLTMRGLCCFGCVRAVQSHNPSARWMESTKRVMRRCKGAPLYTNNLKSASMNGFKAPNINDRKRPSIKQIQGRLRSLIFGSFQSRSLTHF